MVNVVILYSVQIHSKLIDLLDILKFSRDTESFSTDPEPALINIKVSLTKFLKFILWYEEYCNEDNDKTINFSYHMGFLQHPKQQ